MYHQLIRWRKYPIIGRLAYLMLKILGIELPASVKIGKNFFLLHGGFGVVIHPDTVIEDDVRIYPCVTLGRADTYRSASDSNFGGIRICSGAIIGTGAKVLCDDGILVIGADAVIGANAVVTRSVGEGDIWAGVPARRIGYVEDKYRTHKQFGGTNGEYFIPVQKNHAISGS